jgi:hypothetical protein
MPGVLGLWSYSGFLQWKCRIRQVVQEYGKHSFYARKEIEATE